MVLMAYILIVVERAARRAMGIKLRGLFVGWEVVRVDVISVDGIVCLLDDRYDEKRYGWRRRQVLFIFESILFELV